MHNWLREILEQYAVVKNEEWDFFIKFGKTVYLKPKDIFFRSGVIANKIGFLKEGILRACQENNKKEIITSYFYHQPKNNILALATSFALKIPSEHFVEAITDCEVLYFERQDIDKCLDKYPIFERMIRNIAVKQYLESSKRINQLQTKNAKALYEAFVKESSNLVLEIPQHMIASYLGMSQYTLSKIKKQ